MLRYAVGMLLMVFASVVVSFGQGTEEEDVLILRDGTIIRGMITETIRETSIRIQTHDGMQKVFLWSEIAKRTRAKKSTADSTLTTLRAVATPAARPLNVDDMRVLTVLGGMLIPTGDLVESNQEGAGPAKTGYVFGLEAGVRVADGLRWLSTGMMGRLSTELSPLAKRLNASGNPPSTALWCALTGLEYRTEGDATVKFHLTAQLGVLGSQMNGFDLTLAPSNYFPRGTGKQGEISSSGFAYSFGVGLSISRFSLGGRLVVGAQSYASSIRTTSQNGTSEFLFSVDQKAGLVLIVIGVSVL